MRGCARVCKCGSAPAVSVEGAAMLQATHRLAASLCELRMCVCKGMHEFIWACMR